MTTKQEAVAKAMYEAERGERAVPFDEALAKGLWLSRAAAALSAIEPEWREMRGALDFYANDEHYSVNGFTGKSMIASDYGRRARAALSANTQGGSEDGA